MRRKFLDSGRSRLIYAESAATDESWDEAWMAGKNLETIHDKKVDRRNRVVRFTQRYLPKGSRILEGGCGLAIQGWWLHQLGYEVVALDYAPRTIEFLKDRVPAINPVLGDVRALDLEDASFDGYWSLGVIEHFYDGYGAIRDEAARVIRPGGYLFLTFPQMNPLRRLLARAGRYRSWSDVAEEGRQDFYQFALEAGEVERSFCSAGFERVESVSQLGLDGLVDELRVATWARRHGLRNRVTRKALAGVSRLAEPVAGHLRLIVFRRRG